YQAVHQTASTQYSHDMDKTTLDILWVLLCSMLVFTMQAGFLCLEAGATRRKNNINVVIKNISDLAVSVLLFWMFGYGLMFGSSQAGWIGSSGMYPAFSGQDLWGTVFFLFQVMFCSTAVTIVSGAVAERMRFESYLLMSALVSGFIYPVFGHWVWNGLRSGNSAGWLGSRGFVDFAGSTVVHSLGGWVALAAVLILGPRIGRFSYKLRHRKIYGADLPLSSLGVMILWLGWFGFNGGSVLMFDPTVYGIVVNTLLAGCSGLITPILLAIAQGKRVSVTAVMNGALAGLVAITANCHAVTAGYAVLIGMIGSLTMLLVEQLLDRYRIDDVVGAIPVHLGAGIWGTLAVALFGDLSILGTGLSRWQQLQVQTFGIMVCGIWTFLVTYVFLLGCDRFQRLRVSHKAEYIGLNVSEHDATTDLVDFFSTMHRQERTGDLSLRIKADTFTLVGQIAQRYNRVMSSLEALTARTDAIVKTALDAILTITTTDLIIQSANPAVEQLFGYGESQIQGKSLINLVQVSEESLCTHSEHQELNLIRRCLMQAQAEGTPYEVVGRRRSGGTFPVELTVSEVHTSQESFYTLILRDISIRKQAEAAMHHAELQDQKSRQLEQTLLALKRTQTQLVHSEKMSSLGTLVAGVAHEINNPVNFIAGNLEYADQVVRDLLELAELCATANPETSKAIDKKIKALDLEFLNKDMPQLFASMQIGTERIQEIVSALRTFSHLNESGVKEADIHKGIDSTLLMLRSRLKERPDRPEIKVIKSYAALPPIEHYPGQLNQVFMNIVSNAIDALDERDASRSRQEIEASPSTIWINTDLTRSEWVEIRISDNGGGIPPENQANLFDPFFTTKPVGKGTGLGLSISHRIVVETHGGKLSCQSKPGKGTTFIIQIPMYQVPT
ncbi:MAG: ammonium transporter, partial [Leptolyngbyaceae bacterium]|nr:ammonium transporter [Leptolyngbyaceae bacterium]